jgi:HEAT repeat protein
VPTSRPTAAPDAERIRALIAKLKWSRGAGPAHVPLLQIPGNDSVRELVKIGKPAVPFLVEAMTQVERTSPLLIPRHVAAVAVLGEIGEREAVPDILRAMERNRHDIRFVQEAVKALAKLGDRRAIPKLKEIASISAEVNKAREAMVATGKLPDGLPDEVKWWLEERGMATFGIETIGGECLGAISKIDPAEGFRTARRALDSTDWGERLSGMLGLLAAIEIDASLRPEALRLFEERLKIEQHSLVKEMLSKTIEGMRLEEGKGRAATRASG